MDLWTGENRASSIGADGVIREVRIIEADVFVHVVVEAIVSDSVAAAERQLTIAEHVVGESETGTDALGVLVPDLAVALLELGALDAGDEGRGWQERVAIGRRRSERAEVHVRVETLLEVVRRPKVVPANPEVECQALANLPVVLNISRQF